MCVFYFYNLSSLLQIMVFRFVLIFYSYISYFYLSFGFIRSSKNITGPIFWYYIIRVTKMMLRRFLCIVIPPNTSSIGSRSKRREDSIHFQQFCVHIIIIIIIIKYPARRLYTSSVQTLDSLRATIA